MSQATQPQPFTFPTTGQQVRVVQVDGEPWFVAADVCAVLGYDRVANALRIADSDDLGTHFVDPVIQLGSRRLFTLLADLDWIYRRGDHWEPYQRHVEAGRLSIRAQSHYHPRTGELVLDPPQVRITVKGLHQLHRHLGGSRLLRLPPAQQEALPAPT